MKDHTHQRKVYEWSGRIRGTMIHIAASTYCGQPMNSVWTDRSVRPQQQLTTLLIRVQWKSASIIQNKCSNGVFIVHRSNNVIHQRI